MNLPGFELSRKDAIRAAMSMAFDKKYHKAILLLREHEPKDGYRLCFSGGKDSIVVKQLAIEAEVRFVSHYNVTTIDPPELIKFIKQYHKDVIWNRPEKNLVFKMLDKTSGPPTRRGRWCCEIYKERNTAGVKIIGVRAAESPKRAANWNSINQKNGNLDSIAPVLYWSDDDIWTFIKQRDLPYCSLYDEGFKRLGCIGCPMTGRKNMLKEFARWPGFERLWKIGFQKFWEKYSGTLNRHGQPRWFQKFGNWENFWRWWIQENEDSETCQGRLF